MKITSALAMGLLAGPAVAAPTEIARQSFDTVSQIGFTIEDGFAPNGTTDFCAVIDDNGTYISNSRVIANPPVAGNRMFGAVDLLHNGGGPVGSVTFDGVNITGKVNNSVKILLAAPGRSLTDLLEYDYGDPENREFVRVEASIDGGPFVRLVQYSPHPNGPAGGPHVNSHLSLDSDGDGIGDSTTDTLGQNFKDLNLPIGTGSSVAVRVVFSSNGTAEYILFDDLRIVGEDGVTGSPPQIGGIPTGALSFIEGEPAKLLAGGLTLSDQDSTNLSSADITIVQGFESGEDVLAATPSGAILAGDITFVGGTLMINKVAPIADYQAVLRSLTYRNTNTSNPSTAERILSFSVNDGTHASNSVLRTLQVSDLVPVQTIPYTESFETEGRGTRYAVIGSFQNPPAFFTRGNTPSGVTGAHLANVFIADDTASNPAPLKAVAVDLDAEGYTNLKVHLLAGTVGTGFEQATDFLTVEAKADSGAWTPVGQFRATSTVNSPLALDADLNGTGEGEVLGSALKEFSFDLPSADLLGIRVVASSDSSNERIIFDNLRVTGDLTTFAIADASAAENDGTITFNVTRSGNTAGEAQVTYSLTADTASSGTDYQGTTGVLEFEDGVTTLPVTVTLVNDDTVELDETFTVNLSNPSTGIITDGSATGTITNDDSSVISLAGTSVAEGDSGTSNLTFTVSLSNPVDTAVTVGYQTLSTGTATAGADFIATSGTLTINAGATSATFNVTVNGDHDVEPSETVIASIANPTVGGRNVTLGTASATGTITDDDPELIVVDGNIAVKLGTSGKLKVADLLALTSPVEGRTLEIVSVGPGTTAGGTVVIVDGWIYYQPPAGYSGPDTFSFTITDGVQTVTGTITVTAAGEANSESPNIVGILGDQDEKTIVALGMTGRRYQLQSTENLTDWTPLGASTVCPPSGVMSFQDEGPLPPTRFYRVIEALLPPPP